MDLGQVEKDTEHGSQSDYAITQLENPPAGEDALLKKRKRNNLTPDQDVEGDTGIYKKRVIHQQDRGEPKTSKEHLRPEKVVSQMNRNDDLGGTDTEMGGINWLQ